MFMVKKVSFFVSVLVTVLLSCSLQSAGTKPTEVKITPGDSVCAEPLIIDTFIQSKFVNKKMKFKVLLPSTYKNFDSLPLMYLLHGYGGDESSYVVGLPVIKALVDSLDIVLVCVSTDAGWYVNSVVDPKLQYENYLLNELFPFVNDNFKVIKGVNKIGIAGLSMGGFGSLYLSFKHPELFAYVGGSSSCVDIKPYPKNWGLKSIFGNLEGGEHIYESHSPYYMLDSLKKESLKYRLVLDCGDVDFFYKDNNRFDEKLTEKGIKHEYYTSPGDHNWEYWRTSIPNHIKRFVETVK